MCLERLLGNRIIFFDGAMGTMIQAAGIESGRLPEIYNITRPDIINDIHMKYIEAGSDIITTNTFGANRLKLQEAGLTTEAVVEAAVRIAKAAAGDRLVALDIGPIGQLMAPMGTLSFQMAYDLFAQQVIVGQAAGADLILIETIADIYEAKAAILAAKENSTLPIICSLTYQANGRTLMGTDPMTAVTVLESLGVQAVGINCSLGPDDILPIAAQLVECSHIPILVQPNAGLPQFVDGQTIYRVNPDSFAQSVAKMVQMGVRLVGGCCGTTPDFIKALRKELSGVTPVSLNNDRYAEVASSRKTIQFRDSLVIIGERINPSGKNDLNKAIQQGDMDFLYNEAVLQKQAGADILDINVVAQGIDEAAAMVMAVEYIQSMLPIPLQLDSANADALKLGARIYNGKPIINSVNGSQKSMEEVLPIVKHYGACMIAMLLDETGIPDSAVKRLEIARRIVIAAKQAGIPGENIIVDCLVQSAKSRNANVKETLRAIHMVKEELQLKTVLGISNISYGLPERSQLNSHFLAMSLGAGLNAAILDPTCSQVMDAVTAYRFLTSNG